MPAGTSIASGQRQIPGFYYDEVKKRYFKIAHTASGGDYTASAIAKRRKTERERDEEKKLARAIASKLVKVTAFGSSPVEDYIQKRSLGSYRISAVDAICVSRFRSDTKRARLLDVANQRAKITCDAATQTMYVASSRFISSHRLVRSKYLPVQTWQQQISPLVPVAPLRSAASSIVFDQDASVLLATSTGGHGPAEIFVRSEHSARIATVDGTLWCSAKRPDHKQYIVAGTTLVLYDYTLQDESQRKDLKYMDKSDIMTMEFMTSNVLALGCRNGSVRLHDLRVSDGIASRERFTHGTNHKKLGIARILAVDAHQLVVSGLQSSLALYDLRFMKAGAMPLVTFQGHKNEYDLTVNSGLLFQNNLLIVAQHARGLRLWSLTGTGECLGRKETAGQVDDIIVNADGASVWTMSSGLLDHWQF